MGGAELSVSRPLSKVRALRMSTGIAVKIDAFCIAYSQKRTNAAQCASTYLLNPTLAAGIYDMPRIDNCAWAGPTSYKQEPDMQQATTCFFQKNKTNATLVFNAVGDSAHADGSTC